MAEVTDSVWRRLCHLSLSDTVPEASTLIKLTNGPYQGLADEVQRTLVRTLKKKQVLRGRKLRADTTVIDDDIHYPTDVEQVTPIESYLRWSSDRGSWLNGGKSCPHPYQARNRQ